MYDTTHIERLVSEAKILKLSAPAEFWESSVATLDAVYNGIGPDRWDDKFREVVTELLEFWETAALIHDWEYTFQPKNYFAFTVANLRFAFNSALKAWRLYGFTRKAWHLALASVFLALQCQFFGRRGYMSAKPPEVPK